MDKALDGIVVVETAGRLANSICGALLAELGAIVIRVEPLHSAPPRYPALALPGKRRVRAPADQPQAEQFWNRLVSVADAFVLPPAHGLIFDRPEGLVLCTISAVGAGGAGQGDTVPEWFIQAQTGMMAVTGEPGGAPQCTRFPVFEVFTGINAATSIAAALRVARRDGVGQAIDISLFDTAFAMLGTHIAAAAAGKVRGHRVGCKHPLCSPWDVYRCGDVPIQICVASEAQWSGLVRLMKMPELLNDQRFAGSGSRVANAEALGCILQTWLDRQDPHSIVSELHRMGIAAAKIERLDDVLADRMARGEIREIAVGEHRMRRARSPLALSKTPGEAPRTIAPVADIESVLSQLPMRRRTRATAPKPPLDAIHVVEVGPYTAGPLAGRYLYGLGAQVLKVEPSQGEDSRRFEPKFGGISGFFSNYNFGKVSVSLALDKADDRDLLLSALKDANVLLQNLKPGALGRLGIDTSGDPELIVCSISGYGTAGPSHPALDSVIQAESGLMSLVGSGDSVMRSGFSLADLIAAHFAPLAVLAALHYKDRTGLGQEIDIAMLDCMVWALQPAWDAENEYAQIEIVKAVDGYVAVLPNDALTAELADMQNATSTMDRGTLIAFLKSRGALAESILELDEVINHPSAAARGSLTLQPVDDDVSTPILASPFRLEATPPLIGRPVRQLTKTEMMGWRHDTRR